MHDHMNVKYLGLLVVQNHNTASYFQLYKIILIVTAVVLIVFRV